MDKLTLRDIAYVSQPQKALNIPDCADNFYLEIIANLLKERKYLEEMLIQKDELIEKLSAKAV
jgi:hypothetical protein